jgi:two-component sensor histidine kinase
MADVVGARPVRASGRPAAGWKWSAAASVVALASALIVVIFAVFAFLCWQAYWQVLDQSKLKAQRAADVMAGQASWIVSSSLAVLDQVAQQIAADPAQLSGVGQSPSASAINVLPATVSLATYDPAGRLVSAGSRPRPPADVADRIFFQMIVNGADWSLSRQLQDADTATPFFAVAKRLTSGGQFIGVAVLAIDATLLRSLWEPLDLGPDSTVSLVRDDGWVVSRYPALNEAVDLSKSSAFSTLTASEKGTYVSSASPVDGVARIVAYRGAPRFHFIAIASISQHVAFASLWTAIITVLVLLGPIALALLVGAVWTARLLRESARTQANLAAALAHNELLFREIHHRVKNNLQSVSSLLQMQPIPREIKADMGQRIAAMSAVHEHIYRSSDFGQVRVRDYLETLAENLRAGASKTAELELDIEDIAVDKDAATPLGLIVNEVVANAFKHAFPDDRAGHITVRLTQAGDDMGELCVEDNGVGFDPDAPTKGIGRRLIAALTAQLNGQSTFSAAAGGGSRFTLTFPLGN